MSNADRGHQRRCSTKVTARSVRAPSHAETSIIIPTLNERDSLPSLLDRIDRALKWRGYEVLIVDDQSRDGTQNLCKTLASTYPLILLERKIPVGGLSGAVLEGLLHASGDLLVVMDADLQHPPEAIPNLLEPLSRGAAEFAIGSRFVPGARTAPGWGTRRRCMSSIARLLATPIAPSIGDPLSGFFAISRAALTRGQGIKPVGYKIGLELICKCQISAVQEVPIMFNTREHGRSKLGLRVNWDYVRQLTRLYWYHIRRSCRGTPAPEQFRLLAQASE